MIEASLLRRFENNAHPQRLRGIIPALARRHSRILANAAVSGNHAHIPCSFQHETF
jgi:hypothetical protein